jgi:hypothetical protein
VSRSFLLASSAKSWLWADVRRQGRAPGLPPDLRRGAPCGDAALLLQRRKRQGLRLGPSRRAGSPQCRRLRSHARAWPRGAGTAPARAAGAAHRRGLRVELLRGGQCVFSHIFVVVIARRRTARADPDATVTRTMPVGNGGKFTPEARAIYELVREMQTVRANAAHRSSATR